MCLIMPGANVGTSPLPASAGRDMPLAMQANVSVTADALRTPAMAERFPMRNRGFMAPFPAEHELAMFAALPVTGRRVEARHSDVVTHARENAGELDHGRVALPLGAKFHALSRAATRLGGHFLMMTTSRYSPGTTILPSRARLRRPISCSSSTTSDARRGSSSADRALSTGP